MMPGERHTFYSIFAELPRNLQSELTQYVFPPERTKSNTQLLGKVIAIEQSFLR